MICCNTRSHGIDQLHEDGTSQGRTEDCDQQGTWRVLSELPLCVKLFKFIKLIQFEFIQFKFKFEFEFIKLVKFFKFTKSIRAAIFVFILCLLFFSFITFIFLSLVLLFIFFFIRCTHCYYLDYFHYNCNYFRNGLLSIHNNRRGNNNSRTNNNGRTNHNNICYWRWWYCRKWQCRITLLPSSFFFQILVVSTKRKKTRSTHFQNTFSHC